MISLLANAIVFPIFKASKVSSHYLIGRDGKIINLVDEKNRAWHAGVSRWKGIDNLNNISIGIELENPGHEFGYKKFSKKSIELKALMVDYN